MIKTLISSTVLSVAFSLTAIANTSATAEGQASETAAPVVSMKEIVDGLKTVSGKVNPDAKFYIYLQTASWCPPCRKEMPHFVKMYPEMKEMGVEVILLSADKTPELGVKFVTDNKGDFPVVMNDEESAQKLPHYTRGGFIPRATFVDASGNLLKADSAGIIYQWKKITKLEK